MGKPKVQARSSRAAESAAFGQGFGNSTTFGEKTPKATSLLSYLSQPADLTAISNANTIVLFKNLSKRESITKQKALEELRNLKEVEDAVLDLWIEIFPRLSIDTEKRVRQLSHIVNGQICAIVGKRISKHMPLLVGPWLLGLHDNQKVVANAVQVALTDVFNTPEKLKTIRKVYQSQILDFATGIIENETTKTLSDERFTSPDEALAKYNRVTAAALGLLSSLLSALGPGDRQTFIVRYRNLLSDMKLWNLVAEDDAYVRRGVHRLLASCLEAEDVASNLDPGLLSSSYVERGLESSQIGSASVFVESLIALGESSSTIWTSHWAGKKVPSVRIRHFLRKGSQSAPISYWPLVNRLMESIPPAALPKLPDEVEQILIAMQKGINQKDEPRIYLTASSKAFLQTADLLCRQLVAAERASVLSKIVLPIVHAVIYPSPESIWNFSAQNRSGVISKVLEIPGMFSIIADDWSKTTEDLIHIMKHSLPEQASGYLASQTRVAETAARYAFVLQQILASSSKSPAIQHAVSLLLKEGLKICKTRNGKPYGAALAVQHLLSRCTGYLWADAECAATLDGFILDTLPSLITTPSTLPLAAILASAKTRSVFRSSWHECVIQVQKEDDVSKQVMVFVELLKVSQASDLTRDLQSMPEAQQLSTKFQNQAFKDLDQWEAFALVLSHSEIEESTLALLAKLTENLSGSPFDAQSSLHGLKTIGQSQGSVLQSFVATTQGQMLITQLLHLTEAEDDKLSQTAKQVSALVLASTTIAQDRRMIVSGHGLLNVIKLGLETATSESIHVQTLIDQAMSLNKAGTPASDILPNLDTWKFELARFTVRSPATATGMLRDLPGLIFAIDTPSSSRQEESDIPRDAAGFSIPLRMVWYVIAVMEEWIGKPNLKSLENDDLQYVAHLLPLLQMTLSLINENTTVLGSNALWFPLTPYDKGFFLELVSKGRNIVSYVQGRTIEWWEGNLTETSSNFLSSTLSDLYNEAAGRSASAYHCSHAYEQLFPYHQEHIKSVDQISNELIAMRTSKELFQTVAYILTHEHIITKVPLASRWYNETIAILSDLDFNSQPKSAIYNLCLLNTFLQIQEGALVTAAASQRLVFLFRGLVTALTETTVPTQVAILILNVLTQISHALLTVFEEHWETLVTYIKNLWLSQRKLNDEHLNDPSLVLLIASVRVYQTLRKASLEKECNEDLIEAISANKKSFQCGLLNLMLLDRGMREEQNSAQLIFNEVVVRELGTVDAGDVLEPVLLFHLLNSDSVSIQRKAYELLHSDIPDRQEKLSLDIALEQNLVHLPDELLSLILDIPEVLDLNDLDFFDFDQTSIQSIRRYLLSWVLVFDHFNNASHQLKEQYLRCIREGDYLQPLLSFMFDMLGHSKGKGLIINNFKITKYRSNQEEQNEDDPVFEYNSKEDLQLLLCHLYYLCLLNASSITKMWWMDNGSRAVVQNVEKWTAKYFSPSIHAAVLEEVRIWAGQQRSDSDGKTLTIKGNAKVGEVTASYDIGNEEEERKVAILVTLPPNFPLDSAKVSSLNVITFSSQQWQSWLRGAQALMAFSNNNIVDGLVAWRRNIVGALQGKSECTICYSLVSEDGKLPNKKCVTCKNAFHMLCLTKWFSSSGDRKCPLCRSEFAGLGRNMGKTIDRGF